MITSRQRVLAAFRHEEPDRVPAWCGASAEFWAKAKRELALDDEGLRHAVRRRFPPRLRPLRRTGDRAAARAPRTSRRSASSAPGSATASRSSHPLADATLDDVHAYPWPDPGLDGRLAHPRAKRRPTAVSTPSSAATGRPSGTT